MKNISILYVLLIFTCSCNSQSTSGYYTGTMEMNGKTIDMTLDFDAEEKIFSSYDLMLLEVPLSNLTIKNGTIRFSLVFSDAEVFFNGKLLDNEISGTASIDGVPPTMEIEFSLAKQAEKPVKPYSVESHTIKSGDIYLSADIYKPKTDDLHPAIVLLPGSNRDNPKRKLAYYADFFAKLGFEVLIFDKRGSGESTGNSITATYEDLANDAIACLETLNERKTIDKNKIGLWGISQGGMLLPFIASKTEIPSWLITVSPEITGPHEAAAFSDSLRVVKRGFSTKEGHIAAESHRKVAKMICNGRNYKEIEAYINKNADKYNFMNHTGLYSNINIDNENFKGLYWSGRKYNFYNYWKNLNIKTLCLVGKDDTYVNPIKTRRMIESFNNNNIETKLFNQANHILKKTFNPKDIQQIDFPRVKPGYLEFVKKWIQKEIKK